MFSTNVIYFTKNLKDRDKTKNHDKEMRLNEGVSSKDNKKYL